MTGIYSDTGATDAEIWNGAAWLNDTTHGATGVARASSAPSQPFVVINGATRVQQEARMNGANGHAPKAPALAGHSSKAADPDAVIDEFDAIAEANLRRGLYRSQRDAMIAVARDPRCTRRHILVHAIVVGFMNSDTAMAFPGWRAIAEKTGMLPGDVPDPDGGYDHGTIRNLLSDLRSWGYLPSVRRGPEGGGRAIAHYTIAEPPYDKLRAEIMKWIEKGRALNDKARKRVDALGARGPDVTTPGDIKSQSDVTTPRDVTTSGDIRKQADVTRGRAADVTRGRGQELVKEEPGVRRVSEETLVAGAMSVGATDLFAGETSTKAPPANPETAPPKPRPKKALHPDTQAAFDAYVEVGKRRGLPVPRKPENYLSQVSARLRDGSLDEWREMLANLEASPFHCGRNDTAWKADLDWLTKPKNYEKMLARKAGGASGGARRSGNAGAILGGIQDYLATLDIDNSDDGEPR